MLDEVEPDGLRAELVERVDVFPSAGNEGIVTAREAGPSGSSPDEKPASWSHHVIGSG